ncbi:MAG: LysM peptidoglycan-binding domain-containing protein [Gemmatimonadota bacterium]
MREPLPNHRLSAFGLFFLMPALLWGCGTLTGNGTPVRVGPSPLPPILEAPSRPETEPAPPARLPPVEEEDSERTVPDAILDSPWARAPEMRKDVERWIESFQGREASHFREALARMGSYRETVEEEIRNRRLPRSLMFLPVVESWYSPVAVSWVGAAGLWQFMPPTARGMGLRVDRLTDERRAPFRSTPPALDVLSQLRGEFGSWFLALAAYNAGPGRLGRILTRRAPGEEGHDGLFLGIRGDLPRETRDFVPRFLAAATIGMNPEAYGFGDVEMDSPVLFDEVEVPDATSLDVVARAAGVEQRIIESMNPQLLRGLTPAGVSTRIRVPHGRGISFSRAFALIPPEERLTFVEHRVVSGETFTHIARYYDVAVDDLRAANPRVEPRRMQIGQRIIVPRAPSVRKALGAVAEAGEEELLVYRVRSGDTLSAIAVRHRVNVADLLRWNDLNRSAIIRPGDEVRIYPSGGT